MKVAPEKTKLALSRSRARFSPKPSRTIEWFGGVNYQNLESKLAAVRRLLKEDEKEEIHLVINSYGGVTGIAFSFLDTIRAILRPNLITIGSGDVDSSGIIIFLSGRERFLMKNTTILFHLAGRIFSAKKRFSTSDMEAILKEDKLKDYQYACVVSDASSGRLTPEKVLDLMRNETTMTAEEAVSLGLAHGII